MPAWQQIVLYGRERGESFLARAREDAATRYRDARVAERNAAFFRPGETEPAVAVYVEAQFVAIIDAYRANGVPVLTDADLLRQEVAHVDDPIPDESRREADPVPVAEVVSIGRRGRRRGA